MASFMSTGHGCGHCPATRSQTLSARRCRPSLAARHAAWADGLITVNQSTETLQRVLESYRDAGGRGPARLQVHFSWAPTEEEAVAIAHDQWRSNIFAPPVCWDLETVDAFDVISKDVTPEQVNQSGAGLEGPRPARRVACGGHRPRRDELDPVVGQQQAGFIDAFGEHVLPQLSPPRPSRGRRSHEGQRHRRPVVEKRRLLLRRRRDLLRLERGRHRRHPWHDRAH